MKVLLTDINLFAIINRIVEMIYIYTDKKDFSFDKSC